MAEADRPLLGGTVWKVNVPFGRNAAFWLMTGKGRKLPLAFWVGGTWIAVTRLAESGPGSPYQR